jgi:tRNA(Ile)-lysidine synthase
VYVDHRRRVAAAVESAWVRATALRLGARFEHVALDAATGADEASMRAARYAALEETARRCGAEWIATGHTRDDQIETVLMRVLRGASRAGLGGIRALRGPIVRPLLELRRADLHAMLRELGVGWIEDPSNRDLRYTRNRVRHVIVPTVERELGAGRLDHLPSIAAVWRSEDEYLEAQAARFAAYAVRGTGCASTLDAAALDAAPAALRRRVLRAWLARFGLGSPDLVTLEAVERLARDRHGTVQLVLAGIVVVREYDTLRVMREQAAAPEFEIAWPAREPAALRDPAGAWTLEVDPVPQGEPERRAGLQFQVVDFRREAFAGPLVLRGRRDGDRLRSAAHRTRKVHDIMVDVCLPERVRDTWPVMSAEGSVVWVPGVAVACGVESASSSPGAQRVRFTWRRVQI